jgi:hypothetical protein
MCNLSYATTQILVAKPKISSSVNDRDLCLEITRPLKWNRIPLLQKTLGKYKSHLSLILDLKFTRKKS